MTPIYLDNAATSFPKPHRVIREVERCLEKYGGNPGRGSHVLAMAAAEKIYECRDAVAGFLGLSAPENVVFTLNTTYALNMLFKGLLRPGDHVLISDMEHNAVYRPLCKLAASGLISLSVFPTFCTEDGDTTAALLGGIESRIRPETRLLVCTHASNLCSFSLPLEAIGTLCHRHGLFFAVDAAQSAGHLPIDMEAYGIDALCAPGHKGLYGIQGLGLLALRDPVLLDTLVEGGSGTRSRDTEMPPDYPERMEAGTLPTPAIAGLLEGISAVRERGIHTIMQEDNRQYDLLTQALMNMNGIRVYAPSHKGAVCLFNVEGLPSEQAAQELSACGICLRGGLHCCPLGHDTLSTPESGALRASFGMFTNDSDIRKLIDSLWQITKRTGK